MQSSSSESSVVASPRTFGLPTFGGPYFALAVLFGMNMLNYIDRYSFFAVGTQIKSAIAIDDFWYSVLACSPSWSSTRSFLRSWAAWATATIAGCSWRQELGSGAWPRSGRRIPTISTRCSSGGRLLGVGEASYGVIAPALLSDLSRSRTSRPCHGDLLLAPPSGGRWAIDWEAGGQELGWQKAFLVVGIPGILAAAAGLVIVDPGRGASEGKS